MPDAMRSLADGEVISVRLDLHAHGNTLWSPWGLLTAGREVIHVRSVFCNSFNFGPSLSQIVVFASMEAAIVHCLAAGVISDPSAPHEADRLHLQIDKAHAAWLETSVAVATTVERTVSWYKAVLGVSPLECCLADLHAYQMSANLTTVEISA